VREEAAPGWERKESRRRLLEMLTRLTSERDRLLWLRARLFRSSRTESMVRREMRILGRTMDVGKCGEKWIAPPSNKRTIVLYLLAPLNKSSINETTKPTTIDGKPKFEVLLDTTRRMHKH
jgi:hypothetical protein